MIIGEKVDLKDEGIAFAVQKAKCNAYMNWNGIRIDELTLDHGVVSMALMDEQKNHHGAAHGGALYTLADALAGVLARADGRNYVTLDADVHYLRAVSSGRITAEGRVVRRGRTSVLTDIILKDDNGKELTKATITMFCVEGRQ